MPNYQKTIAMGRVGRDPELRQVGESQVASFSIACTEKWTDRQTGELRESVTWYSCSVWGKLANTIMQYVTKGDALFCEGQVSARAYLSNDGEPKASLELKVFNFQFLGGNRGDSTSNDDSQYDEARGKIIDEDIPF
jgi:single-strand DNA-binding protein